MYNQQLNKQILKIPYLKQKKKFNKASKWLFQHDN